MIVTFSEIINEVIRGLGFDTETIESRVLDSIKLRINEAQDIVFFWEDWEWRKRTFHKTLIAPYTTGTISVTQGSKSVTGSGTAWVDDLKRGYMLIKGQVYKIDRIISGTSIKLVAPYDKATESALTYTILFPDYTLNHNIAALTSIKYQEIELEALTKGRMTLPMASYGRPAQCALGDRTQQDYFNGGTVTMTNGSASVTGVGTSWTSAMEGMTFRVNEFSKNYTILDVNSTTSITLDEIYDGNSGSSKAYKIDPAGSQIITFRGSPNDYYYIEMEGLINPPKLVNNNDVSLVPNHQPLIACAIWLALVDLEAKNPIRIQQARADFERTINQLKSTSRIITNVCWRTEFSQNKRRQFNPLER